MTDLDSDDLIESLALRVLDRTLPKPEWTHSAHFALALYLFRRRPELARPDAMREIIIGLNDAHGTPNTDSEGYHHTITIASLKAARSVLASHDLDAPLAMVLKELLSSPFGRSDWIFAYWSPDLLFTPDARREWVEPDRREMPF